MIFLQVIFRAYFDKYIYESNLQLQTHQVMIMLFIKTHTTVNKTLFTHFAFPLLSDGNNTALYKIACAIYFGH